MQFEQTRVLYYIIRFQEGFRLFICWLMMKLAFGSNKELRDMHMHISRVGFEKVQTFKNDIYHLLLVVLPKISP